MIRIFIYPFVNNLNDLEKDNYISFLRKLILSLGLFRSDIFWYIVVPKFSTDKMRLTKQIKKMFRLSNLKQITLLANKNYHIQTKLNYSEMKKISWRDYSIDIVITNLPEQNIYLKKYFSKFTNINPKFISFSHWDDFGVGFKGKETLLINLISYLVMDVCYFNTATEKDVLIEKAVKTFNVNTVRKLNELIKVFKYPSLPVLPEVHSDFDSSPLRIIVFNHKPNTEKSFPLFCASIEELWMKRKDFRVWVPYYQKRRIPFEWMITDIPKESTDDYYYGLKRCYVGVSPRSIQTNWKVSTVDGMLCGLPYILYDSDYYQPLNPSADKYKNRRQLNKHLEFYLDNLEYRNDKAKEALSYVHQNYFLYSVTGDISNQISTLYKNQKKIISSKARELAELIKKEKRISQRDLLRRMVWGAETKFNEYRSYLLSDKNIVEEKDHWKSIYLKG